jgi:hypothetical protein
MGGSGVVTLWPPSSPPPALSRPSTPPAAGKLAQRRRDSGFATAPTACTARTRTGRVMIKSRLSIGADSSFLTGPGASLF